MLRVFAGKSSNAEGFAPSAFSCPVCALILVAFAERNLDAPAGARGSVPRDLSGWAARFDGGFRAKRATSSFMRLACAASSSLEAALSSADALFVWTTELIWLSVSLICVMLMA